MPTPGTLFSAPYRARPVWTFRVSLLRRMSGGNRTVGGNSQTLRHCAAEIPLRGRRPRWPPGGQHRDRKATEDWPAGSGAVGGGAGAPVRLSGTELNPLHRVQRACLHQGSRDEPL